jgi:hypothetical protein
MMIMRAGSTPIDPEFGSETQIRVKTDVKKMIDDEKIIPRESANDCIKRIIRENRQFKLKYSTTQTKEKMESELNNFVLNPDVPSTPAHSHRNIWQAAHPDEQIAADEMIHHINGNHDDNRPENLEKVTAKGHGEAHSQLNKEFSRPIESTGGKDIVGKTV